MKILKPIATNENNEPQGLIWTCRCICNTNSAYSGTRNKTTVTFGTCFCSCFEGNFDNKDANLGLARKK